MHSYKKVKLSIIQALNQMKWAFNEAIPSEPRLAQKYKVSIGTIRRAIDELVSENILIREQGRGTFVISHTEDYMLNVFFRLESKSGKRGLPKSTLLDFKKVTPSKLVANYLKLSANEKIYKIKALLKFNEAPAIIDEIHLPEKLFPDLAKTYFSERSGTLYKLFQEKYGITVVKIHETVEAQLSTKTDAMLLGQNTNKPLLKIIRVAYTYKNLPVDLRIRLVDANNYRYFNTLGGS